MRSGNSPGRIFCIVRPFTLLHFQEFAREGGHATFLSSSLPFPADNAIERLARRSSLTVHQKCGQAIRPAAFFASSGRSHSCILRSSRAEAGTLHFLLPPSLSPPTMPSSALREDHLLRCTKTGQPLGRPVFLFIDKQNRRSRSFDFSCLAEKSKSGVPVTLPEALLFIRSVFRTEPPKFSHGSLRRAEPAAGPQARRLRLHSPQDRYPASDRCRPALQTAPR